MGLADMSLSKEDKFYFEIVTMVDIFPSRPSMDCLFVDNPTQVLNVKRRDGYEPWLTIILYPAFLVL